MLQLFLPGRAEVKCLAQQVAPHLEVAPGHDVVERGHAFEERDVLESPGNALHGGLMRLHALAVQTFEVNLPLLRMIEPVDDIEH